MNKKEVVGLIPDLHSLSVKKSLWSFTSLASHFDNLKASHKLLLKPLSFFFFLTRNVIFPCLESKVEQSSISWSRDPDASGTLSLDSNSHVVSKLLKK